MVSLINEDSEGITQHKTIDQRDNGRAWLTMIVATDGVEAGNYRKTINIPTLLAQLDDQSATASTSRCNSGGNVS
jgi:hypothetical protein